jgi:hypothetical protein
VPLTRRALLAAGAGIAVAGCTGGESTDPTPSGSPDPDSGLVQAAIARERVLLAGYAAAAAADPATADLLAEAATRHEVHLSRLLETGAAADPPATATASPSASSTMPASPPPTPAELRRAERSAAGAGLVAVPQATDPALAGLLASIAASESASAAVTP